MKIYRLNSNINEEMDLEKAIDYLQEELQFKLDFVTSVEDTSKQSEMIEVLLEAYFTIDETEENEEYEDDRQERYEEYRKAQGF